VLDNIPESAVATPIPQIIADQINVGNLVPSTNQQNSEGYSSTLFTDESFVESSEADYSSDAYATTTSEQYDSEDVSSEPFVAPSIPEPAVKQMLLNNSMPVVVPNTAAPVPVTAPIVKVMPVVTDLDRARATIDALKEEQAEINAVMQEYSALVSNGLLETLTPEQTARTFANVLAVTERLNGVTTQLNIVTTELLDIVSTKDQPGTQATQPTKNPGNGTNASSINPNGWPIIPVVPTLEPIQVIPSNSQGSTGGNSNGTQPENPIDQPDGSGNGPVIQPNPDGGSDGGGVDPVIEESNLKKSAVDNFAW
jgi:hypothetical protein